MSDFVFRKFAIAHDRSAHKVGMDGVLLGAWTDLTGATKIADIGSGCGVVAMMLAQRSPEAEFVCIESDAGSILDAKQNLERFSLSSNFTLIEGSFPDDFQDAFDLIVSNPPYFDSGADPEDSRRAKARQVGVLSPASLLSEAPRFLNPEGRLCMITPIDFLSRKLPSDNGMKLHRICRVYGRRNAKCKRVLLEYVLAPDRDIKPIEEELVIYGDGNEWTEQYRALTQEFHISEAERLKRRSEKQ